MSNSFSYANIKSFIMSTSAKLLLFLFLLSEMSNAPCLGEGVHAHIL